MEEVSIGLIVLDFLDFLDLSKNKKQKQDFTHHGGGLNTPDSF